MMNIFRMGLFLVGFTALVFAAPGRVDNRFETVGANEQRSIEGLVNAIRRNVTTHRDAHAKGHGCVDGVKVKVDQNLPQDLRVGFFSEPGIEYDAVIRFSPGSGNSQVSDLEGGSQGLALKILLPAAKQRELLSVFGEQQFVNERYYKTFDIITISRLSEFFVETIDDYGPFFQASGAAGQAAAQAARDGRTPAEIGAAANDVMTRLYYAPQGGKQRPRERDLIQVSTAARPKNNFLETYGSWVPSLYGNRAVKYRLTPCQAGHPDTYVPQIANWQNNPNFLKEVLKYELRQERANLLCFTLSVQFHAPGMQSVEDAVASWNERTSPYRNIATVSFPKKDAGSELIDENLCERMSFHPGHASREHYPIGGIQRARIGGENFEGIYTAIHKLRNQNRR